MRSTAFQNSLKSDKVYRPDQIDEVIRIVRPNFRIFRNNRRIRFFNVPASFDIETTSFYRGKGKHREKCAIMYEWTLGIYGLVIIGRTWSEFVEVINRLSHILDLSEDKRLIIYVHNLAFEFQFMRKHFTWSKVFAIAPRTPVYALTDNGIEFRCSYLLSGYSLTKLGENLRNYPVHKKTGDLDYSLIRHSQTPLTDSEIGYCVNDVRVVMSYIQERIETDGSIIRIPLTKTGYVRNYCRNSCFYENGIPKSKSVKRLRYREIMNALTLDADEYKQLKRAFQGGFTHANPFYSGKVMTDVTSYDFTSSYPAVMLSEQFPMSRSEQVQIANMDDLEKNLRLYCCLFDIEITGLRSKLYYDNYLSQSRCYQIDRAVINNGRVVSADHLITTVTEQDFMIMRQFYEWDNLRIYNFRRYKKGYLPEDFMRAIVKLYQDKTTLKGVEGKEIEYLHSKEMLNSCYGMCVTDIVRDEISYSDDWNIDVPDLNEEIEKYNKSQSRFLFYPWGVWVTAYARRNLFTGIVEFGPDYIYSDTDSIKVLNTSEHAAYIEYYNQKILDKLYHAVDHNGIDPEAINPETIKGEKKPLGVWDFDGHYKRFKTLGAKRYMVEYDSGKISLTVSGLNKKTCVPYMQDKYKSKIFDAFNDDLYVPPEYTGKMTHTYIDDEKTGYLTDYTGIRAEYDELSSVHLENAEYTMSISGEYADYILSLTKEGRSL